MKNKFLCALLGLFLLLAQSTPAFCATIGSVNYRQIVANYSKAKAAQSEIEDKASELQRFLLDKEKEFKKIDSPIQKKNFEEQTAKTFAQKQDAYQKFKLKKEQEIDTAIENAIKAVAIENKIDTVIDARVMFFGNIDITDKVVKKLNVGAAK